MNTKNILTTVSLMFCALAGSAQDLMPNQVPSLVINNFNRAFPKAGDIEWEMQNGQYKVEFEMGYFTDHEVWYDAMGNVVTHRHDISAADLPPAVRSSIDKNFSFFQIDDVEKWETAGVVTYRMELTKLLQEWKVAFDAQGKVLEQFQD